MKTFHTLIKLIKQDMDAKRRDLNVYLDKKEELQRDHAAIEQQVYDEKELAAHDPEAQYAFPNFLMNARIKQENITRAIAAMQGFIDTLQNQIAEAFAELKKYEILLENKEKQTEQELQRKQAIFLEELSMQQHLRQQEND